MQILPGIDFRFSSLELKLIFQSFTQMKKIIGIVVFVFFAVSGFAQKKLVPVSHSELTGISLPTGTKKDGRILSIAAAGALLEMESSKYNVKISNTEVLMLPPFSSGGFNSDSLFKKLSDFGWQTTSIKADKEYSWLQKGNRNVISYFTMGDKGIDLYFGESTSSHTPSGQLENPTTSQPATQGNTEISMPVIPVIQNTKVNNTDNSAILGTWSATASNQSSYRVNNGVMNYIVRQYTFNPDGTYHFVSKAFDPFMDKILLGKENGTYKINGTILIITPKKSVLEAWSKNDGKDEWGKFLSSQNMMLENLNYQFTKHYFSGIREWSLVFQADKQTQRDGPFSGNTAFNNSWIYGPPCSKCLIKLPN
jgi:hypothetical protein